MTVDPETMRRIADLAALEIGDEELPALVRDIDNIVTFVGHLDAVEPETQSEPFRPGPAISPFRNDEPAPQSPAIDIDQLAPESRKGFFLVPRLEAFDDE